MSNPSVTVVGVLFDGRQRNLRLCRTAVKRGWPIRAELIRRPKNKYDRNAIEVMVAFRDGHTGDWLEDYSIGWIPGPLAARWAPKLDNGGKINVVRLRVEPLTSGGDQKFGAKIRVNITEVRDGKRASAGEN